MTLTIEHDERGQRAVVHHGWTPRDAETFRRAEVDRLVVMSAANLDFLAELPPLRSLDVLHLPLEDIHGIESQPSLERLSLNAYYGTPVDFSRFRALKELHLDWGPGAETIASVATLVDLSINRFPGTDLEPLGRLHALRRLRVASAPITSLDGLEAFTSLEFLRLLDLRRLADIAALRSVAATLQDLEFTKCPKIDKLDPIKALMHLRRLLLLSCGDIESLAPLSELPLEEFYFYESTNIRDGDMSVLLRLPRLRDTSFANRRHYTHTREQILDELGKMRGAAS